VQKRAVGELQLDPQVDKGHAVQQGGQDPQQLACTAEKAAMQQAAWTSHAASSLVYRYRKVMTYSKGGRFLSSCPAQHKRQLRSKQLIYRSRKVTPYSKGSRTLSTWPAQHAG